MQSYDVVVIGLSRAGAAVADAAAASGLRVAAVRTAGIDDQADRLAYALEDAVPPAAGPVRFEVLEGPASFVSHKRLSVGGAEIRARRYVIAVGAVTRYPDGLDGVPLTAPLQALTGPAPAAAVVLGGGPVAVVAADRLRSAGAEVTIAARSPRLLPREDDSVSTALTERLRQHGVAVNTSITGLSVSPRGRRLHTRFCCGVENLEAEVDMVVAATGLFPALIGLNLENARVLRRDDRIVTNDEMRTSNPMIFAIGHAATPGASLSEQEHQAEVVAANLTAPFWARRRVEEDETPFLLRTRPPVARVGLTEAQARERFRDVIVSTAPYFESHGESGMPGVVKLVGRRRRGRLVGAHVVGLGAGELILFFDLLLRSEIPIPDVPDRRHFPLPGPSDAAYRALTAWASAAAE